MKLALDTTFEELYKNAGLEKLDKKFVEHLQMADVVLFKRLTEARAEHDALEEKEYTQLRADLAPHVQDFLDKLFDTENRQQKRTAWHNELTPLYACKRLFVQCRAAKALKPEEAGRLNADAVLNLLPLVPYTDAHFELVFAKTVIGWLNQEEQHKSLLAMAARYAAWALKTETGRTRHAGGVLFTPSHRLDFVQLIPLDAELTAEGV